MAMQSQQTKSLYRFGAFRLDATERRLWCEDELISLTPKQFDLLFYFVEHAGHVAKKSELLDAIWSDTYIEETTLARNVSWLRKKLGECTDGESFIETVPKLGYRFTAEVMCSVVNGDTLIIEEQTIQHLRGDEIITIDDGEAAAERVVSKENELSVLPNAGLLSRFRLATSPILIVVLVALALAGSGFILYRNSPKLAAQTTSVNVTAKITVKNIVVDATQENVDTRIKVQPGDIIAISADGQHQHGTGQTWSYEGDKDAEVSGNHTFRDADPWSLVGWIGSETDKTDYFQVSKSNPVTADNSGSLFFAVNDWHGHYANNRGGLIVTATVTRQLKIYAEDDDVKAAWGNELVGLYKGDTLAITATGNISYWPGGELYDLNGSDHKLDGLLAPTINARSLIGKIGSHNPFKVGTNYPPQEVLANGWLFLSVNDQITGKPGAFKNNSGNISISVEVVRPIDSFKNPL
jgi:DNA-binding winged helix-turn-helix (wHTH) protein